MLNIHKLHRLLLLVLLLNIFTDLYGVKVLAYPIENPTSKGLEKRAFDAAANLKSVGATVKQLQKENDLKSVISGDVLLTEQEKANKVIQVAKGKELALVKGASHKSGDLKQAEKEIEQAAKTSEVVKKTSKLRKVGIYGALAVGTAGVGVGSYYLGHHVANEQHEKVDKGGEKQGRQGKQGDGDVVE